MARDPLPQPRDQTERHVLAALERVRVRADHELLDVRRLADKAIGVAETRIVHGLGRVARSWMVARPRADARVWESKAPDSSALYVIASAAVTVDILVW